MGNTSSNFAGVITLTFNFDMPPSIRSKLCYNVSSVAPGCIVSFNQKAQEDLVFNNSTERVFIAQFKHSSGMAPESRGVKLFDVAFKEVILTELHVPYGRVMIVHSQLDGDVVKFLPAPKNK